MFVFYFGLFLDNLPLFVVLQLMVAIIDANCIDHSRVLISLWDPILVVGYL